MTNAGDIMHQSVECIRSHESAGVAARLMAEHDIGALPICDAEDRVIGMVTDRDLAIQVMAAGFDAEDFQVGDLLQSRTLVVADIDEDADLTLAKMAENQVRRVPVVENGHVTGIISQADVARSVPDPAVGQIVTAVSAPA